MAVNARKVRVTIVAKRVILPRIAGHPKGDPLLRGNPEEVSLTKVRGGPNTLENSAVMAADRIPLGLLSALGLLMEGDTDPLRNRATDPRLVADSQSAGMRSTAGLKPVNA